MKDNEKQITPDDRNDAHEAMLLLRELVINNNRFPDTMWAGLFLSEFFNNSLEAGVSYENVCWILAVAQSNYKILFEEKEKDEQ